MSHWDAITEERLAFADVLDGLTPEQWAAPSLCSAWTVQGVVAHLVTPLTVTPAEAARSMVIARGSLNRLMVQMAARRVPWGPDRLVATLRERAERRVAPPGIGSVGPLTDALVHQQDALLPLGIAVTSPPERWRPVLDFLLSPRARIGFVRARVPSLTYVAPDAGWSGGSGPRVEAPAAALALALLGRTPRLDELAGPGAAALAAHARR